MFAHSKLYIFIAALLASQYTLAQQPWEEWLDELREEAISSGIDPMTFEDAFENVRPNRRVSHFDKTQPEKRITFMQYRKSRVDNYRIVIGRKKYKKHKALLDEVGATYGISPCIITAIWGMETSYGHFVGDFYVIKSLATLAYNKRRSAFFRKELLLALRILEEGHVSKRKFVGEWAGATGQPQFLPSSFYRYAVDFDQDGNRNIWTSHPDVFASIANYMVKNKWQANQPWSIAVKLPSDFDDSLKGYKVKRTVREWRDMGVVFKNPRHVDDNLMASVLTPYGGPSFMIFDNFRVILRYNRSTFYGGAISYLANQVCRIPN